MNLPAPRTYNCFPALLLFFAAVTVMDLDQMVTVRHRNLATMEQYRQSLEMQKQVAAQEKWIGALRQDLLRMAPGDPEAAAIVSEMGLKPRQAARPSPH